MCVGNTVSNSVVLACSEVAESTLFFLFTQVNRFFKHGKETLRFKVVWDDPSIGGRFRATPAGILQQNLRLPFYNCSVCVATIARP